MLEGYIHKIKYEFNRGDSMLRKLLLINIGAFVVFYSLRTIMHLSNASEVYELYIQKNLLFTVNLDGLLFKPWSLISYMFMHVGFGHIFFNMLLFFWMGSNFQDYLGNKRLLYVYIMGGVFAALVLLGAVYLIPVLNPMIGSPLIGASASIYAVTCAFATLLPNYEYSLFGMFNVRLKWIAWTLVFISFTEISNSNPGGNITHIGGALFGYLYIKFIYARRTWLDQIKNYFKAPVREKSKREKVKVYESSGTFIKPNPNRKPTQEEIDIILDKIHASGYESLNQAEKELLFKASHDD